MPATHSSFARLLLKYPLFLLIAAGFLAAIVWWNLPGREPSLPLFSEPSEKHRPALKTAMSTAIKAFYAKPDSRQELDATGYIRDYRRTFPGAKTDGTDPGLTNCNIELECAQVRERQKKKIAALAESVPRQFPHLAKDSPKVLAALAEAYALDRELAARVAVDMIEDYARRYPKEAELLKFQADLFRVVDEIAAAGDARPDDSHTRLSQYVDRYIKLSWQSLKPIPSLCSGFEYESSRAKDPAACNAAMAEHEAAERKIRDDTLAYWKSFPTPPNPRAPEHQPFRQRVYLAKAEAIKKLLVGRQAPESFMRSRTDRLLWSF